jgi:tetratricopeptide (TPR) repeat protein
MLGAALALAALLAAPTPAAPAGPGDGAIAAAIRTQDWPRLEELARTAARRDPKDSQPWLWIGVALANQGKQAEAGKALRRGIAVKETAALRHRLGQLLLGQGKPAAAERELLRATRLAEGDQVWGDLARAQVLQGKDDAARRSLARARQLSPDPRAFEDVQAELASREVLRTLPPPALAALQRAASQGAREQAEKDYREVARLAPDFGFAHYQLGRLAEQRGDLAAAEGEYRTAIARLRPVEVFARAEACEALARTLLGLERKGGEARSWAEQAIALRGERPEYLATLARACEADGNRECALDSWDKVAASSAELPAGLRKTALERLEALRR